MLSWWLATWTASRTTLPTFPRTSSFGFWEPMCVIMLRRRRCLRGRNDASSRREDRSQRIRSGSRFFPCEPLCPLWLRKNLYHRGHRGSRGFTGEIFPSYVSSPALHCSSPMSQRIRVLATCDIGDALNILRHKGYDVEVYPRPEAPPKSLIVEKVKSGVDGLITTLRDSIDAEVFAAGRGTLRVVAQFAVGFDNINRAAANKYKVPFTNTADVLTEATAEVAFFMMGALARKLWPAEHLTRENRWGYWHPYLPFLGDEVTGKTIAIIGTGRIGLAMIKKCAGFDMNILCYDPAYQNRDYVNAIQENMDLRHARGISRTKNWIKYVSVDDALGQADFVSVHVPLLRA